MDFLRLPTTLRRSILSHPQLTLSLRRLSSATTNSPASDHADPLTPEGPPPTSSLLTLSSATLNSYTVFAPPSAPDLKTANAFFLRRPPVLLYTAAHFRSFPPSPFPEVAFLGRSNVGKSSLLNALLGQPNAKDRPAHVSRRPGRTKTMNGFGVGSELSGAKALGGEDRNEGAWKQFGRGGLVVVDMPGYGGGSREEWGKEALKYIANRKQLRRTFVLVDSEHGLKRTDVELLTHLRRSGIAHQVIMSKVDKILFAGPKVPGPQRLHSSLLKLQDICATVRTTLDQEAGDGRKGVTDILCCSAEKGLNERIRQSKIGIDELRWAILTACGMEKTATVKAKAKAAPPKVQPARNREEMTAMLPMGLFDDDAAGDGDFAER